MQRDGVAAVDWASNARILDMLVCPKVEPSRDIADVHIDAPAARTEPPPVASALAACQRRFSTAPAQSLKSMVRSSSSSVCSDGFLSLSAAQPSVAPALAMSASSGALARRPSGRFASPNIGAAQAEQSGGERASAPAASASGTAHAQGASARAKALACAWLEGLNTLEKTLALMDVLPLFEGLPAPKRRQLAKGAEMRQLPRYALLYREFCDLSTASVHVLLTCDALLVRRSSCNVGSAGGAVGGAAPSARVGPGSVCGAALVIAPDLPPLHSCELLSAGVVLTFPSAGASSAPVVIGSALKPHVAAAVRADLHVEMLAAAAPLSALDEPTLRATAPLWQMRRPALGEALYTAGELAEAAHLLVHGAVRISNSERAWEVREGSADALLGAAALRGRRAHAESAVVDARGTSVLTLHMRHVPRLLRLAPQLRPILAFTEPPAGVRPRSPVAAASSGHDGVSLALSSAQSAVDDLAAVLAQCPLTRVLSEA